MSKPPKPVSLAPVKALATPPAAANIAVTAAPAPEPAKAAAPAPSPSPAPVVETKQSTPAPAPEAAASTPPAKAPEDASSPSKVASNVVALKTPAPPVPSKPAPAKAISGTKPEPKAKAARAKPAAKAATAAVKAAKAPMPAAKPAAPAAKPAAPVEKSAKTVAKPAVAKVATKALPVVSPFAALFDMAPLAVPGVNLSAFRMPGLDLTAFSGTSAMPAFDTAFTSAMTSQMLGAARMMGDIQAAFLDHACAELKSGMSEIEECARSTSASEIVVIQARAIRRSADALSATVKTVTEKSRKALLSR